MYYKAPYRLIRGEIDDRMTLAHGH
jgi:hypothetical protein